MGNKTYKDRALPALVCFKEHFDRNDKSDHITRLDNVVQIIIVCLLLPKKIQPGKPCGSMGSRFCASCIFVFLRFFQAISEPPY